MRSLLIISILASAALAQETRQAMGVKVGEVTDRSAIVWIRLTENPERNWDGVVRRSRTAQVLPPNTRVDALEGAAPGAPGQVRLRYGLDESLSGAVVTKWMDVTEEGDFSHQFQLEKLKPAHVYYYSAETVGPDGKQQHGALRGRFETAPRAKDDTHVCFTVVTGMMYEDLDHRDGFHIYESMAALRPQFIVPTGDTVYYDNEDPRATTLPVARYHWQRMYSLPRHIGFHLAASGYWMKDDHDTYDNDSWPTKKSTIMPPLTFADGVRIWRQQVPIGRSSYRTFRWGKGLQIWLPEGREFRSPNDMEDGPGKTIWGEKQKRWFKRSMRSSDAEWKVLISATPIIGPDRKQKADNHANAAFKHEGDEIRAWLSENVGENVFLVCGDRHWQYHSVHPATGLNEFSCGPASDEHAGGTPGVNEDIQRYHAVRGGFLSVSVNSGRQESEIAFRHHDVHGSVMYEYARSRRIAE